MTAKTAQKWAEILIACGVRQITATAWAPIFAAEVKDGTFSKGDAEIDDFLGQVLHESSMLERLEEGLSYSAERMCQVWPKRFPTAAAAAPYARNPRALANHVYGGRLGNTGPDDGWLCRGSGLVQVTGLDNLRALARIMGYADPYKLAEDLRSNKAVALRASILWWEGNVPDGCMGNIIKVTQRVNGGAVGLEHREQLTAAAGGAINA